MYNVMSRVARACCYLDDFHVIGAAAGDYGSINEVKKKVYSQVLG